MIRLTASQTTSLLFGLLLAAGPVARADVMHCVAVALAPCDCKAALVAKCDGAIGNVDNDQHVETLTVHARQASGALKSFTIRKPKFGVVNYFPLNDEAREELSRAGGPRLSADERGYVGEFTLDKGAPFYQDEDETAIASRLHQDECGYVKRPNVASLVAMPSSPRICFGQVRCGPHHMEVACSAVSADGCPSADNCIDDASVRLEKARIAPAVGGPPQEGAASSGAK